MNVDYLLGNDFFISRLRDGADSSAEQWLQRHADARLGMPWIIKGEFLKIARFVGFGEGQGEALVSSLPVLMPDAELLRIYASLPAEGIPSRDQWLIASALRLDVPLVTNELTARPDIPRLKIELF